MQKRKPLRILLKQETARFMTIFGALRSSTERAGGNFSTEKYSVPEN